MCLLESRVRQAWLRLSCGGVGLKLKASEAIICILNMVSLHEMHVKAGS